MKIVLLGSIPKGDDVRSNWVDWKLEYKAAINAVLPGCEFIDGDAISDNAGADMVVGHDLSMVKHADVCVVDGRQKIGAGTAQEMIIAKYFKKPVVTVVPLGTHHRKSNVTFHGVTMEEWVHPFLKVSSDYTADNIEQAAHWIQQYQASPSSIDIKDMSIFEQAITNFESSQS